MAEKLIENTGFTQENISFGLMDLLNGSYTDDIINDIEKLQEIFGKNFEKLYELNEKYNGKAYTKEVIVGKCRCMSCLDIQELHICIDE